MQGSRLKLENGPFYRVLQAWPEDQTLILAMQACIAAQRRVAERMGFAPAAGRDSPVAGSSVTAGSASEGALRELLARAKNVRGLSTEPEISNVQSFNARNLERTWMDRDVAKQRRALDRIVLGKLRESFPGERRLSTLTSGHWWYPPGSEMGWHTNSDSPGWRLYLVHAEEPGRSGFRYLHPESGDVVTDLDREWCARLFLVPRDRPFWHAVFSETNRFSFGYLVRPRSWSGDLAWHLRRLGQAARRRWPGR